MKTERELGVYRPDGEGPCSLCSIIHLDEYLNERVTAAVIEEGRVEIVAVTVQLEDPLAMVTYQEAGPGEPMDIIWLDLPGDETVRMCLVGVPECARWVAV